MLLNMKSIKTTKMQINTNIRIYTVMMIAIQMHLKGKKNIRRKIVNIKQRNQRSSKGIHLTVTMTIRKIENEDVPIVAIGRKKQKNQKNTKKKIKNENDEMIKYLILMSKENLKNTDLDRLVDDNIHSVYILSYIDLYICVFLIKLIFSYGLIF